MLKYDFLIVGSGLYGCVFAYKAKQSGKRVLVIDKRPHNGGNLFCEKIENINIHKYGAHIFHTSNKMVWDFVNNFVSFNRYTNCPLASYHGKLFNLPFNMNTFYSLWGTRTPDEAMAVIDRQRKDSGIIEPLNLEEQALSLVGKDIYEILIKEYTEKQWGHPCNELPAFIIKRLPVRFTFDNNYFNDTYQGIPIGGYNKLIDDLLKDIEVRTNTDFFNDRDYWSTVSDKIVFTGRIDEFYNCQFGKLEYRTVSFETEILNCSNYQGNAVINYTSMNEPYTRIIEHKHFEPESPFFAQNKTVISKEYSSDWTENADPFYPVNDYTNNAIYNKYKELACHEKDVFFGGRLADYKYYDMDDVIEKVLNDTEKIF
ncbi:UDP-galactopyranose mutase [Breznakiella homolactica]|uniref:UDP-galactopyranose mutase n=1 Tax=Breznakiella homolactica TaxID=2798577 RepID=UPI003D8076C4